MTYDRTQSINAFLAAAAAKQPVPGGGSIAALAGALAAAMGEMVINYSLGKKDLSEHQPALQDVLSQLTHARVMLLELMVEDQDAYQAFSNLRKLPDGDPQLAEKPKLAQACVDVPLSIGATALAVLTIADKSVEICNKWLLSDLAVASELAMATVRCAGYNVNVNLPELAPHAATKATETMQTMLDHGTTVIRRIIPAIQKRQSS
jgi:methenyltetrahydrofolate cyclohydrolase